MLRNLFLLLGAIFFTGNMQHGFSSPPNQDSSKRNRCFFETPNDSLQKTTTKTKKRVTLCSFEGCAKHAQTGGLCVAHGGGTRCSFDGCAKHAKKDGLCKAHAKTRCDDEKSLTAGTEYPEWLYELCGHNISRLIKWIDGDLEHFDFD